MTPRVDVVYLVHPVTPEAVAEAVRDSGHSCFPVVHEDLDGVDGVLFVNDLFRSSSRPRGFGAALPDGDEIERKIRRRPVLLPESLGVLEALESMREQHRTFALVMDEHGGVAGVVSTRDLLEPLVGELGDEFDEDEDEEIIRIRDFRWLVDGQTHLDKVAEEIGVQFPEGDYVTIAGYVIENLGVVPDEGAVAEYRVGSDRWTLRVQTLDKRRIRHVVVEYHPETPVTPPSKD